MRAQGNRLKAQRSQLLDHCPSSSFIVLPRTRVTCRTRISSSSAGIRSPFATSKRECPVSGSAPRCLSNRFGGASSCHSNSSRIVSTLLDDVLRLKLRLDITKARQIDKSLRDQAPATNVSISKSPPRRNLAGFHAIEARSVAGEYIVQRPSGCRPCRAATNLELRDRQGSRAVRWCPSPFSPPLSRAEPLPASHHRRRVWLSRLKQVVRLSTTSRNDD